MPTATKRISSEITQPRTAHGDFGVGVNVESEWLENQGDFLIIYFFSFKNKFLHVGKFENRYDLLLS